MNLFSRHGLTLSVAVVTVGAVCVSCGAAEKPSTLLGQWVFAEGYSGSKAVGKSVAMFNDGTGVVDDASMTWKVESKRLMILTANVRIACDYNVSGYELVLTYDDEMSATFVKKGKLEEYAKKREEEKKKNTSYFTDSRNGQKYRAVKIGGKSWMAQNLNYQTGNSWCYGDDNSNCEKYGRLYDWKTAKTACPSGWHLPSRAEWDDLVAAAGGGVAGTKLKSTSGWNNDNCDGCSCNGTDEFGFSALPGGNRYYVGSFDYAGLNGYLWTATEDGSGRVYFRDVLYYSRSVGEDSYAMSIGFSVRCIGD